MIVPAGLGRPCAKETPAPAFLSGAGLMLAACALLYLPVQPVRADQASDKAACEEWIADQQPRIEACRRLVAGGGLDAASQAHVHAQIADALYRLNRYEEALAEADRAIGLDVAQPAANNIRATLLGLLGRKAEADRQLEILLGLATTRIEADPADAQAWRMRASVHFKRGEYEAAIADQAQAIRLEPDRHSSWLSRGYYRQNRGDHEGAIADIERAMELIDRPWVYLSQRAQSLIALGRLDEALADMDRAVAAEPGSADNEAIRSTVLLELGRVDEAVEAGRKAAALAPRDAHVRAIEGYALLAAGRYREAIEALTVAIGNGGAEPEMPRARGEAFERLGERERAIADYRLTLEMEFNPDSPTGMAAREHARQRLEALGGE